MYDEASKEKDSMVVKYAQAEKKFIEGQKSIERLEAKVRDLNKEKDGLTQRVTDIKGEKRQMLADLEAKVEMMNLSQCLIKCILLIIIHPVKKMKSNIFSLVAIFDNMNKFTIIVQVSYKMLDLFKCLFINKLNTVYLSS